MLARFLWITAIKCAEKTRWFLPVPTEKTDVNWVCELKNQSTTAQLSRSYSTSSPVLHLPGLKAACCFQRRNGKDVAENTLLLEEISQLHHETRQQLFSRHMETGSGPTWHVLCNSLRSLQKWPVLSSTAWATQTSALIERRQMRFSWKRSRREYSRWGQNRLPSIYSWSFACGVHITRTCLSSTTAAQRFLAIINLLFCKSKTYRYNLDLITFSELSIFFESSC